MVDGIGERLLDRVGRDVEGSYGLGSVFDLGRPLLDDGVADLADGIAQLSVKGTDNDRLCHSDPRWIGFVDDLDACVGDVRIGPLREEQKADVERCAQLSRSTSQAHCICKINDRSPQRLLV